MWGGVKNKPAVHLGDLLDFVLKQAFRGVVHWWHCQAALLVVGSLA
jgi:hypothetical protein